MSEYPWDMENMVLGAHQQPCDCAICDEIHFNRAMRKKRMKEMINYCDKKHGPMNIGCAYCEIDKLREENERFKVMYKGFENQFYKIQQLEQDLESQKAHSSEVSVINRALSDKVEILRSAITSLLGYQGIIYQAGGVATIIYAEKALEI